MREIPEDLIENSVTDLEKLIDLNEKILKAIENNKPKEIVIPQNKIPQEVLSTNKAILDCLKVLGAKREKRSWTAIPNRGTSGFIDKVNIKED